MTNSIQSCADNLGDEFSVYCGNGHYVQAIEHSGAGDYIEIGAKSGAICVPRRVAIGAVHTARSYGLSAWVIRHPSHVGVVA